MYKQILFIVTLLILWGCSESDKPEKYWEHATAGALSAAISHDGSLALISSSFNQLILWDLNLNAQKYRWTQGEDNLVLFTALSPNNKFAVSADKHSFVVWDINTGKSLTYTRVRESAIRDIAVANNGDLLIGKVNGVVVHVNIFSGRRLEFLGHNEKINSIAMSPNGRYALSGSNDYTALFWDTTTGQVIHRFIHPTRVTKVALDHVGKYAFSAGSQRQSSIWDLTTGQEVSRLQYQSRSKVFSAVRFSNDSHSLYTGSPGRLLNRWHIATGKKLAQWKVTTRRDSHPVSSVIYAISEHNSGTIVTESSSGFAEFWKKNASNGP